MPTALSKKDESRDSNIHANVVKKQQQGALIFVVDKDIYFQQHCLVHPQYLLMRYTEQEDNSFQVLLPTVLLVHNSNPYTGGDTSQPPSKPLHPPPRPAPPQYF